ncbi:MAG TPA: hypothetical protein VIF15_04400 [Polyangiaceae bacterium]|jgi:hypothetical protein
MKIDRSLFLVLTGALAGSAACEVYVGDGKHRPPQTASGTQPTATATTPGAATTAAPAQPPTPTRTIPLHLAHGGVGPIPSGGGTTPPTPTPTGSCLDANTATVPACALQAMGSTCSGNTFPAGKCAVYAADFDPKVAAAAVTCMNGLSGAQLCDSMQTYNCGKTALAQACPDPSVTQLCAIAATSCKSTAADCTAMLSGLNDKGKQAVASCIAQGCSAGLYSCIEGLSSSTEGSAKAAH